jgi:catechol 2,3-dioxygenase-like lactoylglutathione lyase family enzyme
MTSKSTREPWRPADEYGRSLPTFTVNLIVRDLEKSAKFYAQVLTAELLYRDEDFAALRVLGLDFMLHADHTYDQHPWRRLLKDRLRRRGTGAELRLFGMDPDALEKRARKHHAAVLKKTWDTPHGWRETSIADPDGYVWAVGAPRQASAGAESVG